MRAASPPVGKTPRLSPRGRDIRYTAANGETPPRSTVRPPLRKDFHESPAPPAHARRSLDRLHHGLHRRVRARAAHHPAAPAGHVPVRAVLAALPCVDRLHEGVPHLRGRVQGGRRHPRRHEGAHPHRVIRAHGRQRLLRAQALRLDRPGLRGPVPARASCSCASPPSRSRTCAPPARPTRPSRPAGPAALRPTHPARSVPIRPAGSLSEQDRGPSPLSVRFALLLARDASGAGEARAP